MLCLQPSDEMSRGNEKSICMREASEIKAVDSIVRDWYEVLVFDNTFHTVKIDTGAQANVIAAETLKKDYQTRFQIILMFL